MDFFPDSSPSLALAVRDSGDDQKNGKGQLCDTQPVNDRVQLIETTIAGI
jgi:hypothetical protein